MKEPKAWCQRVWHFSFTTSFFSFQIPSISCNTAAIIYFYIYFFRLQPHHSDTLHTPRWVASCMTCLGQQPSCFNSADSFNHIYFGKALAPCKVNQYTEGTSGRKGNGAMHSLKTYKKHTQCYPWKVLVYFCKILFSGLLRSGRCWLDRLLSLRKGKGTKAAEDTFK